MSVFFLCVLASLGGSAVVVASTLIAVRIFMPQSFQTQTLPKERKVLADPVFVEPLLFARLLGSDSYNVTILPSGASRSVTIVDSIPQLGSYQNPGRLKVPEGFGSAESSVESRAGLN